MTDELKNAAQVCDDFAAPDMAAALRGQPAAQATHDEDETTLRDVDPKADAFLADQQATPEPVRWPEAPKSAGMATSQEAGKWRITLEFDHDTDASATHTALMDAGWLHRTIRTQPATPTPQQAAGEPVGEPFGWFYMVNGVHERFILGAEPPPEDAYDAGTLVATYTHPAPAVPEGFALVPMTPGQVIAVANRALPGWSRKDNDLAYLEVVRAVESHHAAQLTAAQAKGGA